MGGGRAGLGGTLADGGAIVGDGVGATALTVGPSRRESQKNPAPPTPNTKSSKTAHPISSGVIASLRSGVRSPRFDIVVCYFVFSRRASRTVVILARARNLVVSERITLPPTLKRRCSCGSALAPDRTVLNQHGGIVATQYRCAKCGASFGLTTVGRIVGALVGAATFGFVGGGALSQLGNRAVPTAVVGGLGAVFGLIAIAFVFVAVRGARAIALHPVVAD